MIYYLYIILNWCLITLLWQCRLFRKQLTKAKSKFNKDTFFSYKFVLCQKILTISTFSRREHNNHCLYINSTFREEILKAFPFFLAHAPSYLKVHITCLSHISKLCGLNLFLAFVFAVFPMTFHLVK